MSNKYYFGTEKNGNNRSSAYIQVVGVLFYAEIRVMIPKSDFYRFYDYK
jgi:hypothetical protein